MERGAFMCLCPPRYSGKRCESGRQVLVCRFPLLRTLLTVGFNNWGLFRGRGVSLQKRRMFAVLH